MELITILNRCYRFRGFVYEHAHFSADKKSIEVGVRPRKGSAAVCSRCHLPAPGYDQLTERRFEFIPLWGFLVFLLYTMRRVSRKFPGAKASGMISVLPKEARIVGGEFLPGERLIEEEIARVYRVSCTPIREILFMLESAAISAF